MKRYMELGEDAQAVSSQQLAISQILNVDS
jgi:hypothetical protein